MRIKLQDITLTRVVEAVNRRVKNVPHSNDWVNSRFGKANTAALESFRNKHAGERCFVIANGPSLATMDLSPLRKEVTFGMNRLYLIREKMGFLPTYHSVINDLVLEQFTSEIAELPTTKFVSWSQRHLFANPPGLHYLRPYMSIEDKFSYDLTKGIYSGGTVTYATLQLAYYMGFKEVYLVGLDHNFADKGRPNTTEVREQAEDKNHFHPDYFPKGVKWQLPDLYRSELSYALARQAFEADGRFIKDATLGGKCDVFEKVSFESIL